MTVPNPNAVRPVNARVVKAETFTRDGMEQGRVWVEAYLPFDAGAFAEFTRKALELGGGDQGYRLAAQADPELARKALDPIDAHGEAMLPEDLETLADGFLVQSRKIDVMHDENARAGINVVGSFLNTPEVASPNFYPGAWVTVIKVEAWTPEFRAIKAGTLNAVSFQALVSKIPVVVTPAQPSPGA
jgi:hypothetical protein